jgi:prepilin-type N-terminal cleavage/methylation domain-containing protein
MRNSVSARGFTLVELLVAVAILALFTTVSIKTFGTMYRTSALRTASLEIVNALRDARAKTLSAENDMVYGVRVGTSSVTRFIGSSYTPGHASNTVYYYEGGASATGTLVRNGVNIVFTRLTGEPSATGTIYIRSIDSEHTATVTVSRTGLIE